MVWAAPLFISGAAKYGGMCTMNNALLDERMRIFRDHGMSRTIKYQHDVVGFNYRMTNLQAAIGLAQLERIGNILLNRRKYERGYREIMSDKNVVFQEDLLHRKRITWLVSILLDRNVDRDKYIKDLKSNGIDARPFFCALSSMNIYKKYCHVETPMIKPVGTAKIYNILGEKIIRHQLDEIQDLEKLRKALSATSKLLFNAEAEIVILPLENSQPVNNYSEALNVIKKSNISQYQLLSVHAMSSCAMGVNDNSVCDTNGKVRGINNLYVCDASILPTNIGESPQGTIMAFSHLIIDRYLNKEGM